MISLLGSALTCLVFGTATSLQQAICIRLLQGIFAGAVVRGLSNCRVLSEARKNCADREAVNALWENLAMTRWVEHQLNGGRYSPIVRQRVGD